MMGWLGRGEWGGGWVRREWWVFGEDRGSGVGMSGGWMGWWDGFVL
jgi:hypothetical protein